MSSQEMRVPGLEVPGLNKLFVGGTWTDPRSGDLVDVVDPATGKVIATAAAVGKQDADDAAQAAALAFDSGSGAWPRMAVDERIEYCRALLGAFEARIDPIIQAWVLESGATIRYSEIINRDIAPLTWKEAIGLAERFEIQETRETPTGPVTLRHEPVGPVLAIYAYNAPLIYFAMKVLPALMAGNTVIAKPAEESQLTSRLLCEAIEAAKLPPGVLSVLPANAQTSQYLVGHPLIDMVSVTAGTAIGIDAVRRTADRLARVTLELGGKSPAIITDDADLDAVLEDLVPSAIGYAGQTCVTLSRVLVSEDRHDEVVDALAAAYKAIRIGDPSSPDTDMGPLAVERARDRVEHYVQSAKQEGARVVTGGQRPSGLDSGWYYEPTLLADVTNDMTVAQNEVFGPVTAVIKYQDIDDAVRIANDTKFGLAASVYSSDLELAADIASRIRAGAVSINTSGLCITEPFGGFKQSGFGREYGYEGFLGFTEIKQLLTGGAGSLWDAASE